MVFIVGKPTIPVSVTCFEFCLVLAIMHREFLKSDDTILIGIDSSETDVAGAFRCKAHSGPYQQKPNCTKILYTDSHCLSPFIERLDDQTTTPNGSGGTTAMDCIIATCKAHGFIKNNAMLYNRMIVLFQ
jgi:hypothetical protein